MFRVLCRWLVLASLAAAGGAQAQSDQWYVGVQGGLSRLDPDPVQPGLGVSDTAGSYGGLLIGRDIDTRSSAQLHLFTLGDAELDNGDTVGFTGAEASLLYRFFDSRDRKLRRTTAGAALYARFGLGTLQRDSTIALNNDTNVYFGVGAGVEYQFTAAVAARLEAAYQEQDAASAGLALVWRFGGSQGSRGRVATPGSATPPATARPPEPAPTPMPAPAPVPDTSPDMRSVEPTVVPTVVPTMADADGDGIADSEDACPASAVGYPVRDNGCALFDGVLSGVTFVDGTAEMQPGATAQLDSLARLLGQYPDARVEIHAHVDSRGTVRDQAILTRARLKAVGTYLVQQGIRANRLVLRSFGGTRPLYPNDTPTGREGNNRIEVIESPN